MTECARRLPTLRDDLYEIQARSLGSVGLELVPVDFSNVTLATTLNSRHDVSEVLKTG